mmetsp:Transcript_6643/g.18584  ORF Transcript_6643/g.18584 Transcript_6643/m.18584 type:complete len:164 (+) Transcript_6643:415-906(+)
MCVNFVPALVFAKSAPSSRSLISIPINNTQQFGCAFHPPPQYNNNNNNNNEEFEDLAPIPYFPEMMNKPLDACSGRTLPSHPIEPLLHSLDPMPRSVVSADNDDEQYNWREAISNIESNYVVKNDRSNDSWNLPVISFDGRGSEKNQILFQPMDPTEMDSIFE